MKDLAMAVVIRGNNTLVQKRHRKLLGMVYEFPGGKIDQAESPEQAAIRELAEETGLILNDVLGCHEYDNQLGGKVYFVVIRAPFDVEPTETDSHRQQIFYWLSSTAILNIDLYAADKLFVLQKLDKYLNPGHQKTIPPEG